MGTKKEVKDKKVCSDCGDRLVTGKGARGLCASCYGRHYARGTLSDIRPAKRRLKVTATCVSVIAAHCKKRNGVWELFYYHDTGVPPTENYKCGGCEKAELFRIRGEERARLKKKQILEKRRWQASTLGDLWGLPWIEKVPYWINPDFIPAMPRNGGKGFGGAVGKTLGKPFVVRDGDCLLWQSTIDSKGYAKAGGGGQPSKRVHRLVVAWAQNDGVALPRDQCVHHICGNRNCVNPDHLQIVSYQENSSEAQRAKMLREEIAELKAEIRRLKRKAA